MSFLLVALLLQGTAISPNFFNDGERIVVRSSRLFLGFTGFSRADMIEIVPVGRQDEPSIRVTSATVRNLMLRNRDKSYVVTQNERQRDVLSFRPADLGQDNILIVTVPEGLNVQISYNGNNVPIRGTLKETLFLNGLDVQRGKPGFVVDALNERLKKREIVLPVIPSANPKAQLIHSERPDLTGDERRILDRLSEVQPPAISFEATVTDTGQVIEVRPLSGIPPRLPRGILEKLEDAAMRHSFEPYVVDGKAATFTTTITLEMP